MRSMAAAKKQQVLFVRIPEELAKKLDARVGVERRARKGLKITKSDVVRELLVQNAKVDAVNYGGSTPLEAAMQRGHLKVERELLEWGANPWR